MRSAVSLTIFCALGLVIRGTTAFLNNDVVETPLQRTRRQQHQSHRLSSSSSSDQEQGAATTTAVLPWTRQQLEDYASSQGVVLSLTTLGPGYRALARSKHNTTQIMGYIEGFVRPGNTLLHVDKMEVFRKILKQARTENPDEFKGGGTVLGVGLLIGYLCMLHGQEQGCGKAEFLAIDDEDFQHRRLVRYYKQAGFEFIKYVGDDFGDIPDRLVWGGCGTLLRQDIPVLLEKWTRLMERSLEER